MKTRRQVWWREEKSRGKDERIVWPGPQMMLATRLIHIYRILHHFPKGVAVWPQWTRSRRNRGDFTIQCRWPRAPYRCYSGFWTSYPPPPPRPNLPANMDTTPHQTFLLSSVCIIFGNYIIFGGVKSAEDHFSPRQVGRVTCEIVLPVK